jgi:putative ABC transport system permease protein
MSYIRKILYRITWFARNLIGKRHREQDLDDEVRSYLDLLIAEKTARGMNEKQARRTAAISLGGIDQVKEAVREVRMGTVLEQLLIDARYALRMIRRRPAAAVLAIAAIGLGIGSTTTILSVADAVLVHSVPVRDLDRTVMVWQQDLRADRDRITFSPAEYRDYVDRSHSFESIGALHPVSLNVKMGDTPLALEVGRVTLSLFDTLDIKPVLGRAFAPEEESPGRDRVALLTHGLWQSQFGSNPQVLGTTVQIRGGVTGDAAGTLDGSYTIIGVLPPMLPVFYTSAEIWIPLAFDDTHPSRTDAGLRVFGRLRKGISVEQATTDVNLVATSIAAEYPDRSRGVSAWLVPLRDEDVGDIRPTILTLLAAVTLLLSIVCANVATILLTRTVERRQELSVRLALGAGRPRLIKQLVTESLVLGLMGAGLGILLAYWTAHLVRALGPASIPRIHEVVINGPALAAGLMTSVLASVLFGLAPALRASRPDLAGSLSQRSGPALSSGRLQRVLVALEIALVFVVLVAAAVVAKSFIELQRANLGYDPNHLLTLRVSLPQSMYSDSMKRKEFFRTALARIRAMPEVESAGAVNVLPQTDTNRTVNFTIVGRPARDGADSLAAQFRITSPGYFRSLGAAVLRGREFTESDLDSGAIVVSRSMAEQFWPGQDPLGHQVRLTLPASATAPLPIVGVVEDIRQWNVTPGRATIYWSNMAQPSYALAIRTLGDPMNLVPTVKEQIRMIDPDQPVYDVATMERRLASSQGTTFGRFRAVIMTGFGLAALGLALIGVYGLIHHWVAMRTREFGIRMALGARRLDVIRIVLRQGLSLVLAGSGFGLAGSIALTRILAGFLYGVGNVEPWIIAVVAVLLGGVGAIAALVPASRAARIDPMVALRYE